MGAQLNLVVNVAGGYSFLSRAGKTLPALQAAFEAHDYDGLGAIGHTLDLSRDDFNYLLQDDSCIYPEGFMLQAEIVTPGQPAEITAGNLRRTKGAPFDLGSIEVHVFGVVPLDVIESGGDHDVTHSVMKYHVEAMVALLQKHVPILKWSAVESLDVFNPEELQRTYEARREAGEEGLVLKDPNAIWRRGKKVGQWKMKPEDTIDGKVVGLVWGTPGLSNEGKVIGFEVLLEDGHVVNACGLTQGHKDGITGKVIRHSRNAYGDDNFPTDGNGGLSDDLQGEVVNPYEGWAVEVAFMERFKDGSLRHPSFSRWRGISDPMTKE